MHKIKYLLIIITVSLAACSQTSGGRYAMKHDTAPQRFPTEAEMLDPTPRFEPYSKQGNRPYRLFGISYQIIDQVEGYAEEGIASWYGRKFHGHLTSNGEYFDMFNMTAAHKTLPLPSYIQVTNLNNNLQAIVRVNDRGPFHANRILDLSYAAAYRLGITQTGTAPVRIEVITQNMPPLKNTTLALSDVKEVPASYIQIAASRQIENIEALKKQLKSVYEVDTHLTLKAQVYRLLIGPFNRLDSAKWLETLSQDGYVGVFRTELVPEHLVRQNNENSNSAAHF